MRALLLLLAVVCVVGAVEIPKVTVSVGDCNPIFRPTLGVFSSDNCGGGLDPYAADTVLTTSPCDDSCSGPFSFLVNATSGERRNVWTTSRVQGVGIEWVGFFSFSLDAGCHVSFAVSDAGNLISGAETTQVCVNVTDFFPNTTFFPTIKSYMIVSAAPSTSNPPIALVAAAAAVALLFSKIT